MDQQSLYVLCLGFIRLFVSQCSTNQHPFLFPSSRSAAYGLQDMLVRATRVLFRLRMEPRLHWKTRLHRMSSMVQREKN